MGGGAGFLCSWLAHQDHGDHDHDAGDDREGANGLEEEAECFFLFAVHIALEGNAEEQVAHDGGRKGEEREHDNGEQELYVFWELAFFDGGEAKENTEYQGNDVRVGQHGVKDGVFGCRHRIMDFMYGTTLLD